MWLIHSTNTSQDKTISDSEDVYIKGCYHKIANEIYCGSKKDILSGVDVKTFQVLDHLVAKDKNHVYIINQIYPNLDPKTFDKFKKTGLNLHYLFADKNGVYNLGFDNKIVPLPLDVETATSVDAFYIRDKNGIYFNDYSITKVNDVDPASFHILGGCASVEKSYAEYVADKDHVFVGTQILPGINPDQFVEIAKIESGESEMPYTFFLWKDMSSKSIYVYCGAQIKEADYNTFKYIDGRAQDKNNYYNFNTGGGNYTVAPKK